MPRCSFFQRRRRRLPYCATVTFLVCYMCGVFFVMRDKDMDVRTLYLTRLESEVSDQEGDDSARGQLLDLAVIGDAVKLAAGIKEGRGDNGETSQEMPSSQQQQEQQDKSRAAPSLPPPIPGFNITINNPHLRLIYEPFNFKQPRLATVEDFESFFNLPGNMTNEIHSIKGGQLRGVVEIIPGGVARDSQKCGWESRLEDFRPRSAPRGAVVNRRVPRATLPLLSPFLVPASETFQHFVDGVLPKVVQAHELLLKWNVTLLIHKPKDAIVKEIYEDLGFNKTSLLFYKPGDYASEFQINTCITPPMHPVLWEKARRLLGVPSAVPNSASDVILFVRKHNGRAIQNLEEVKAFLSQRYKSRFKVVNRGLHSLDEARKAMSTVGIVLGIHGGALYNVLFAPPKTNVVEIMQDRGTVPQGSCTYYHMENCPEHRTRILEDVRAGSDTCRRSQSAP